ncbi:MAG TPA: squalene/phytoene synthase family protein, partial [Dongiaceae bacterium]|nr:squalene/phytoene synthase family protein [Dongiaceae bacterium]
MTSAPGGSVAAVEAPAPEAAPSAATQSSGSSFYAAMRVLPAPQRDAMYEIYAFCRAVDDIADGSAPRA